MVITPEVGRHVHYYPGTAGVGLVEDQPHAAIVTHVHGPRLVNLTVFDRNGLPVPKTSVQLQQPGDDAPVGSFCRWMPYTVESERKRRQQDESAKHAEPVAAA